MRVRGCGVAGRLWRQPLDPAVGLLGFPLKHPCCTDHMPLRVPMAAAVAAAAAAASGTAGVDPTPPSPSSSAIVDGKLHVNGERFFPVGFYVHALNDTDWAYLARAGYNTALTCEPPPHPRPHASVVKRRGPLPLALHKGQRSSGAAPPRP